MRVEAAIVGGGPAGLSASLVLGRCRRNVPAIEHDEYRNFGAKRIHGFLTRDHDTSPEQFRAMARNGIERYPTVLGGEPASNVAAHLGAKLDDRGSVIVSRGQESSISGLFVAGDAPRDSCRLWLRPAKEPVLRSRSTRTSAEGSDMPTRTPKSYDQITHETVIEPDGGWRPSDQQEVQALEEFRALDDQEQALSDRVDAAIAAGGRDLEHVQVEVERNQVTLRGSVKSAAAGNQAVDLVRGVTGVASVIDRLVTAW